VPVALAAVLPVLPVPVLFGGRRGRVFDRMSRQRQCVRLRVRRLGGAEAEQPAPGERRRCSRGRGQRPPPMPRQPLLHHGAASFGCQPRRRQVRRRHTDRREEEPIAKFPTFLVDD